MQVIDYFSSMTTNIVDMALRVGRLMALIGIIWNCIQMIFGTMESRRFLTGMITKWFLFLACMSFFPAFSAGLRTFALGMGQNISGLSIQQTTESLSNYMNKIQELIDAEIADERLELDDISRRIAQIESTQRDMSELQKNKYNGMDTGARYANSALLDLNKKRAEIEARIASVEDGNTEGYGRVYNAIRNILIIDNTDTTPKYNLKIEMVDKNGKDTGYFSPNALFRLSCLSALIMWETYWEDDIEKTWEENDKKGLLTGLTKKKSITKFPVSHIFNIILCFLACIMIIVTSCAMLIQYVANIVEYAICSTFGIITIPLILFDGLKDTAQKLIPFLISQAVKLSMITICMFLCSFQYISLAQHITTNLVGFNFYEFGYIIFTCFLTFVICSNAPKLAVALLSGNPQLSMGEFVQAAAAAAGAAHMADKAVHQGAAAVSNGAKSIANGGINALGDLAAMGGAFKAGNAGAREGFAKGADDIEKMTGQRPEMSEGAVNRAAFWSGMSAAGQEMFSRGGRRMATKAENWMHSGKSGGAGGGHGAGGNGWGTSRYVFNDGVDEKGNIKDKSNSMKFDGAMNYDKNGNSTYQTPGEFIKKQATADYSKYKDRMTSTYRKKATKGFSAGSGGLAGGGVAGGRGSASLPPPSLPGGGGTALPPPGLPKP